MLTYLWYDFETFGADPKRDRISQFAGIRTDEDFNILEEYEFFCKLSKDYIPNPEACLVTGINPQEANENGISEEELSMNLFEIFTKPNTVSIGYNSFKFDDEILRHLFYRTFRNPYKREWANGCSRWDFLRGIMAFYIKSPESLIFPKDSDGKILFKLEFLSKENGIIHENAHDALSDVRATIALAKFLKEKNRELFEYIFNLREKNQVIKLLNRGKFFLHGDFTYGAENSYQSVLYKLDYTFSKDEYIFLDLNSDLDMIYKEDVESLKKYAYMKKEELEELGKKRPGIKTIKANSLPLIFPEENVSNYSQAISKAKYIEIRLRDKVSEFLKFEKLPSTLDIEIDPYNNFFNYEDEANFSKMHEAPLEFSFENTKWEVLFRRYKARNFYEFLDEKEKKSWETDCYKWLNGFEERSGYHTFDSFFNRIDELKKENLAEEKRKILIELEEYVYSLKEEVGNTKIKTEEQTLFHIKEEPKKPKKIKVKVDKTEVKDEVKPLKLF